MYQDELEQFLQEEVKQHRMYPSDHIWKNIRTELHGNTAWPALTFISLFIITALTISTLLNNHPAQNVSKGNRSVHTAQKAAHPASAVMVVNPSTATADKTYFEKIAPEQITAETFADLNENRLLQQQAVIAVNMIAGYHAPAVPAADHSRIPERIANNQLALPLPAQENITSFTSVTTAPQEPAPAFIPAEEPAQTPITEKVAANTLQSRPDIHASADDFLKDFIYVTSATPRRNSKFGFQFYITPSTSYRRLSDEKVKEIIQPAAAASVSQNIPLSLNYSTYSTDVNNVVRHRPAIGMEVGFGVLYNMSNRFKLKTGVQLNIRQYYIETFQSLTNDLTSLSLINFRGVETINFYSAYNNNTGYKKAELDNKVYQVSVPVGLLWEAIQSKHFGINVEASVQPTLTLNNNTYLLSTDYKHYTDGNDFIRKWNINTSLGFNISYKAGATSWQIGPQVRYQHLPTYSNAYPLKEYLMDYGVRLGITRQIK
ncbi:MAG: outer membrane protein beta-barrel protein [Sediminibacterium sp.]|nr:outer membrane protein beta-barrel protein [Sediminibacterium sp.]